MSPPAEVDGSHHVPVRFQKRVPRSRPLANRCRFNAVLFQDVANRRVRDVIADIVQGAPDPVVTPGRILAGKLQSEVDDVLTDPRPTFFSFRFE
jgi:hypothetical protein